VWRGYGLYSQMLVSAVILLLVSSFSDSLLFCIFLWSTAWEHLYFG
jgi:hypothetical protein